MKNELREAALSAVMPIIAAAFPESVNVTIQKKDMVAINTGYTDEEGRPVYATIDVTIKDPSGTDKRLGFDIDKAIAAYDEKQANTTERKSKAKSSTTPKNTEAAEKRNKRVTALRAWWMNEAEDEHAYTSTEVLNANPDIYGDYNPSAVLMTVGSDLKMLSETIPTNCEMMTEKGKRHYVKHA